MDLDLVTRAGARRDNPSYETCDRCVYTRLFGGH
jgi:hypothetical protein